MKKPFSILITSLLLIFSTNTFAQSNIEGILDKAISLAGQKSEGPQIASLLGTGVSLLEREANTGNADIKNKLLGQLGALNGLIPLANSGKLDLGSLSKIVNTVKMLVAANRLKTMLSDGKSNLSQNETNIARNLNLLKAGSSVLGSSVQNHFGKLLASTTKSVGKLDKSGLFGKLAASATNKKLEKIISLVTSAL
ncbi:hypothetical protein [Lacihabitans sp. CS3-21]|uniref:hypothetical protein n=1 Tax=Lacihabitans sp. CS3-21 TaxID=2487332 RepID=UPI0020CDC077|nr:hypothetical protein [Lacihabitans sp. CS3-21]